MGVSYYALFKRMCLMSAIVSVVKMFDTDHPNTIFGIQVLYGVERLVQFLLLAVMWQVPPRPTPPPLRGSRRECCAERLVARAGMFFALVAARCIRQPGRPRLMPGEERESARARLRNAARSAHPARPSRQSRHSLATEAVWRHRACALRRVKIYSRAVLATDKNIRSAKSKSLEFEKTKKEFESLTIKEYDMVSAAPPPQWPWKSGVPVFASPEAAGARPLPARHAPVALSVQRTLSGCAMPNAVHPKPPPLQRHRTCEIADD